LPQGLCNLVQGIVPEHPQTCPSKALYDFYWLNVYGNHCPVSKAFPQALLDRFRQAVRLADTHIPIDPDMNLNCDI